ncbi:hypothetical protein [Streptomyces avidinii]|uniref:N-acetyltransferase n=1 Tax=Streptomyces avidinii TaxID=1895 RepID=A0ABS4KZK9_STRAV|nr:hypothetical protein [Streptomyces avidinii]MBP2034961.1 hypothetical protein [Streptomyces avidinii]GGY90090.1 hypothetical protein GCM10010343_14410 [Streptomyces avidinii]
MSGDHARSTSALFRSAPQPGAPPYAARQGRRREGLGRRLRRRIRAYRDIEFLSTHIPGDPSPGQECLLLVHVRKVVGQVHYQICTACGTGVITGVDIDEYFLSSGLGNRALAHLRSRHPGISWRSTLNLRTTRDLLRRMCIPAAPADVTCVHTLAATDAPLAAD